MNISLQQFGKGASPDRNTSHLAVAYTRVSTKEQADNNQSLETQAKAIDKYAQDKGLQVIQRFGGTYESAQSDERKEFKKMMDFVKRKKVGSILVYSFDRFSRSGANAVFITDQLKKSNVQVVSVTQPVDAMTSSGELQQHIQFIFANYDNQLRREKCIAGIKEMLLKGEWPTQPPVGYTIKREGGIRTIEINEKGLLIRRAFKKKLKEDCSFDELSRWLNLRGLKLSNKRLSEMARNVFYCGYMAHKALDGQVVKGNHQGLITKNEFLELNDMLQARRSKKGRGYNRRVPELPLKGHVKCACCGQNMTGYLVNNRNRWYYKCNTEGCKSNISANHLHEQWISTLSSLQIEKRMIQPIKDNYMRTLASLKAEHEQDIKLALDRIKSLSDQIKTVKKRFAIGLIDQQVYKEVLTELEKEQGAVMQEWGEALVKVSNESQSAMDSLKTLSNLLSIWENSNLFNRKQLIEALFPNGIWVSKENGMNLTQDLNAFAEFVGLFTGDKEQKKKRNKKGNFTYSALVARSRIELPTSGL